MTRLSVPPSTVSVSAERDAPEPEEHESPGDLPRLLGHPRVVRMCRAAGQVDAAAAEFNKEQHIQALEPYRVDRKEIHGDDAVGLRTEELSP